MAKPAPDSDLVKLTREFETLRDEIKRLNDTIKEHEDGIHAANVNHEMGVAFHLKKINHATRLLRVAQTQFTNVTELLQPLIQTDRACNGCVDIPHPLFRNH